MLQLSAERASDSKEPKFDESQRQAVHVPEPGTRYQSCLLGEMF